MRKQTSKVCFKNWLEKGKIVVILYTIVKFIVFLSMFKLTIVNGQDWSLKYKYQDFFVSLEILNSAPLLFHLIYSIFLCLFLYFSSNQVYHFCVGEKFVQFLLVFNHIGSAGNKYAEFLKIPIKFYTNFSAFSISFF